MRPRTTRTRRRDPIHLLIEQLERREVVSETLSALAAGAAFAPMVPAASPPTMATVRRPSFTQSATPPAPIGVPWAVSLSAGVGAARPRPPVEPLPVAETSSWSDPFADDLWADDGAPPHALRLADDSIPPPKGGGEPVIDASVAGGTSAGLPTPVLLPASVPATLPATADSPPAVRDAANAPVPAAPVAAAMNPQPADAHVVAPDDPKGLSDTSDPKLDDGGTLMSVFTPATLTHPSYVIDVNKGAVLSEAVYNHDFSSWTVDLRAQVTGATVGTYTWDFGDADEAGSISPSGYKVQFTWDTFNYNPLSDDGYYRDNVVELTEQFVGGGSQTQTFHFRVASYDSPARTSAPTAYAAWPTVARPDAVQADAAAVAGPHHTVNLVDGTVATAIDLPAYNPGVAPVRLVYNSLAADARPIYVTRYEINPAVAVPATVDARLTVNGTPLTTYGYDTSLTNPGDFVQIALQTNATGLATGRYSFSVAVKANYGTPVTSTYNGDFNVVNDAASPFGAGWWVDGVDRIVTAGDGVVLVSAGGRSLYFNNGPVEGNYVSPAGDFSTLLSDGSSWTRTLRDGTVVNFNSSGQQVSVVDRNDNRTTYAYSSGRLSTITDPNNLTTTFAYDGSSKLATITDPALRTTTFTVTAGKLTRAVDPASGTWTYTYDGDGRLTNIADPRTKVTTFAYDTLARRAQTIYEADGAVETIALLQRVGLPTGGADMAVLTAAATAGFTDGNNHLWQRRLDWAGFGQSMQLTDPVGNVGVQYRSGHGLAWLDSNGLGHRTDYHYDGGGNPTRVIWADDSHDDYTYNGFAEVLTHTDGAGETTTYVYDGDGNLTSVSNALVERTTMTYDGPGNLVRTVTPRAPFGYDEIAYATTLVQYHSVAMDADGDTMMVWQETGPDGSGYGVYARRYTRFGVDLGPAFRVNSHTTGDQVRPAVALDEEGDFVVAWTGYGPSGLGVYARRYNAAGTAQGNEALVATVTVMDQIAIAADATGDFVVAWTDTDADKSGYAVRARLYNSSGSAVTSILEVNAYTTDDQNHPRVAMDATGDFVVVWQSTGQDGDSTGVYARQYDDEGVALEDEEFAVNTTTTGGQSRPTVAMDAAGNFVVAWHGAGTGDSAGIFAQRFNAAGVDQGDEFLVNSYTTGTQTLEAAAADAAGNFVVVWYGIGSGDGDGGVFGRRFDASGAAVGGDFRVNAYTTGIQGYEAVAADADGDFVVTWMGAAGSSGMSMYARRYAVTADTRYAYDSRDRVTTMTDAEGGVTSYGYDTASNVTTVTDPLNRTSTHGYDLMGRRTHTTLPYDTVNAAYPEWDYTYNGLGLLQTATDPLDHTTTYSYDENGRPETTTDPLAHTATTVYDLAGNVVRTIDAINRITTFAYDDANRLVELIDANVHTTVYDVDEAGQVLTVTDPLDRVTTYTYTELGQTASVQTPAGESIDYGYNPGHPRPGTETHSGSGVGSSYSLIRTYDELGRLETVTNALPATITYEYDPAGNLARVIDPEGHATAYAYDGLNRRVAVTDALGHTTRTAYDAAGNPTVTTDALGHAVTVTYDAQDRRRAVQDANGGRTTFSYDLAGRLRSLTDPGYATATTVFHSVTTFGYDAADRHVTTVDPNNQTTTYEYDFANQLTAAVDRGNRRREFLYDNVGQVETEKWVVGTVVLYTATYTYADDDQLLRAEDNNSVYNYAYDADTGLLETVSNVGTPSMPLVTLTYDVSPLGLVRGVADDRGGVVTYNYDNALRLTGAHLSVSSSLGPWVTMLYDNADRLRYVTRGEGTGPSLDRIRTTLSYDNADRLTEIEHSSTGGALDEYAYGFDAGNRLTNYTGPEGVKTFTYDAASQLTGVAFAAGTNETFTYDPSGNRTMSGYATGAGNRLLNDGTYTYTYDNEGNVLTKSKSGERWEYTWDYRNRLTEVKELTGVGGTVVYEADYTYDVFDRRIGVLEDKDGVGSVHTAVQLWTLYDEQNVYADFNGAASLTARYLNGREMDQRFATTAAAGGSVAWYLGDNLGSVRQVVQTGGSVLHTFTYSAFGIPNSSAGDRFKFTGREWNGQTGQYFYRARYYGAGIGRFVSQDPLSFSAGDINLYRYVENSSIQRTDPSGQWSWGGLIGGIIGAIGGTLVLPIGGTVIGGVAGAIAGDRFEGVFTANIDSALQDRRIRAGFAKAWMDSNPHAQPVPVGQPGSIKCEHGGWICYEYLNGRYTIVPRTSGARDHCGLAPVPQDVKILGTFHTHPNTVDEGYAPEPSPDDIRVQQNTGVPMIIIAHDGNGRVRLIRLE